MILHPYFMGQEKDEENNNYQIVQVNTARKKNV